MGAVDDTLFELKLALDRALAGMFGSNKHASKHRYCPACGTSCPEGSGKCPKCFRSFELYNRK